MSLPVECTLIVYVGAPVITLLNRKKKNLLPVIVLVKKKHVKNREKGTM